MSVRRTTGLTATLALLLGLGVTPVASAAPDPTYPTGTYTTSGTTGYMRLVDLGDISFRYDVYEQSASDDLTPSDDLQRTIDFGNGDTGDFFIDGGYVAETFYGQAGTYFPEVELTDGDGHTTHIPLPPVTVLRDTTDPVVTIALPEPRLRHRVAGWRVLRGTARDPETGVYDFSLAALQRRHGRWYSYDFENRRWRRGTTRFATTVPRAWGTGAGPRIDDLGRWHTKRINGLTRGRLVILTSSTSWGSYYSADGPRADYRLVRR